MRIDSHHHFWKYDPKEYSWIDDSKRVIRRDFLPADLKKQIDQVGIEGRQPVDNETSLQILIEKDFACIDGNDEENADTFPNPLAGLKC